MFSPTQRPLSRLFTAAFLVLSACAGDEGGETETPITPIITGDSGAPPATTPPPATSNEAGAPGPSVTTPRDAGTPTVTPMDAAQPLPPSGDTGTPSATGDAGAGDAMASGDGAVVSGDGGPATGSCCPDGKCLCHGNPPASLSSTMGPYRTMTFTTSAGCVHYPTDGKPPYAAVAVSDGFLGTGGCGVAQTGRWGNLYASWGIVTMIVNTGSGDQPSQRGTALTRGIASLKMENTRSGSPLMGKLAGRYGTSGFSMGGGGTTFAAADDATLLTNVLIMPYGPTREAVTVPSLVICGSSDSIAPCSSHGTPFYGRLAESVPKMRVTVSDTHAGQPSAGGGRSGQVGLAFQKVFLENDQRWKPLLTGVMSNATNIR